MLLARLLLLCALVALPASCKNTQPDGDDPAQPVAPAPAAEDASPPAQVPPGETETVSSSEDPPEPALGEPELVQAAQPGFEIYGFSAGDGLLLWNEKNAEFVHRIYRRELDAGEPEQLGEDGRYQSIIRVGNNAQVVGDLLRDRDKSGAWEMTGPGKQRMIDHRCYAVHGSDCFYFDDDMALFRRPVAGGKAKRLGAAPPWAKAWGKKGWRMFATDGDVHFRVTLSPAAPSGERERHVEAFLPPAKKPLVFDVEHIVDALAAHDGALYFDYERPGRDGASDVRRLEAKPGAAPERVFSGRDLVWLHFEGAQAYGLHPTKGPSGRTVWLLARVDPDSDAFETIAELSKRPGTPQASGGYFYYYEGPNIYRIALR